MKNSGLVSIFLFALLLHSDALHSQNPSSYEKDINNWDQKRIEALTKTNGWLNLAGLFWLDKGENSFGSSSSAKLKFLHPKMPSLLGNFVWKEKAVYWIAQSGIEMKDTNGQTFTEGKVFDLDSEQGTNLQWGQFIFTIIKREDKIGIRFRDLQAPTLLNFHGIPRFPVDPQWKIVATLEPSYGRKIPITNVLGQTTLQPSPGKLVFTFKGQTYKLDAIDEGGSELFVIFGDATSGLETYPAGRFMYIPKPDSNNQTLLDFNKAFNPPCAFTDFATCPLPPRQNILEIEIKAGEKTVHPAH